MEALSPIRLLPLFFWQGRNDDAHEREPDAEGLSQREAFPRMVKAKIRVNTGMRLPKRATMPGFKMLEREVEAQVHEETHAEAHIEQTADCGHGDVDGHGRREHEGQEHDGPAERLNGGNTQEGVAPGNEAHAHGVARRGQDGPDHQQVAEDGVGRLIRAFGGEGGPATPATASSMAIMVFLVSFSPRNSHAATAVQRGKQAAMTPPCDAVV